MTRDDLAPLGDEHESFPCPRCNGGGVTVSWADTGGALSCNHMRCPDCNGSGYGPPPPSLDRERSHCLRRLAEWAHRARIEET